MLSSHHLATLANGGRDWKRRVHLIHGMPMLEPLNCCSRHRKGRESCRRVVRRKMSGSNSVVSKGTRTGWSPCLHGGGCGLMSDCTMHGSEWSAMQDNIDQAPSSVVYLSFIPYRLIVLEVLTNPMQYRSSFVRRNTLAVKPPM